MDATETTGRLTVSARRLLAARAIVDGLLAADSDRLEMSNDTRAALEVARECMDRSQEPAAIGN